MTLSLQFSPIACAKVMSSDRRPTQCVFSYENLNGKNGVKFIKIPSRHRVHNRNILTFSFAILSNIYSALNSFERLKFTRLYWWFILTILKILIETRSTVFLSIINFSTSIRNINSNGKQVNHCIKMKNIEKKNRNLVDALIGNQSSAAAATVARGWVVSVTKHSSATAGCAIHFAKLRQPPALCSYIYIQLHTESSSPRKSEYHLRPAWPAPCRCNLYGAAARRRERINSGRCIAPRARVICLERR